MHLKDADTRVMCSLHRLLTHWKLCKLFRLGCLLLGLSFPCLQAKAHEIPPWLPRYDLDVTIDVHNHFVQVREQVTWINRHDRPTKSVLFNNHSHFAVPEKDIGFLAKSLEILRLAPSEALYFDGPPCEIAQVLLIDPKTKQKTSLPFHYLPENDTALVVSLPFEVSKGQAVTLELKFSLKLPQRQGRWGQWKGVTFLAQWLPVLSYYDNKGWQPAPFVPWHQPFHNEAGIYRAKITVPADEIVGCTGSISTRQDLQNGWQQVTVGEVPARDFAIFCSKRFQEVVGQVDGVNVRCLHLPGHEFYARELIRIAAESIPVYNKWFGQFPYKEFTFVESFFGWNGNECGGLVMIDSRIFGMPHMGVNYVDSLVSHEILHQWFYNAVGTDGYAETWMDEGIVTHFSHRLQDQKLGRNNPLINYPKGLGWLPNIHREDFRLYGMYSADARGDAMPTVQKMEKFGHLANLMAMAYDRGGKITGMIENQLGPAAMLDFMRIIYRKYYFRVIHVREYQRELELYTGRSWQEFFDNWLYGPGMSDWCIEKVNIEPLDGDPLYHRHPQVYRWLQKGKDFLSHFHKETRRTQSPVKVQVLVRQKGEYNEPTVLGISLDGSEHYQIRVPIYPHTNLLVLDEISAKTESISQNLVRVEIVLPCRPTQITVDPDQVIIDRHPCNNSWKTKVHVRFTPVLNQLDETDIVNAHDRLNILFGPWGFGATFKNPWFTRDPLFGFRAGLYRTQRYQLGSYIAYRSNDRNIVAGVDGVINHYPFPKTQLGFIAERSITTLGDEVPCSRGVFYARYVKLYSSSLYLPPFEYIDAFATIQDRCLPLPRIRPPGANLLDEQTTLGIHYHKYYLTPYWDPEGGFALDATYQAGLPILDRDDFQSVFGQVSTVKFTPDPLGILESTPLLRWLKDTRWAFRLGGAASLPDDSQLFSLGGGDLFRGFDLRERQGSLMWLASVEWRVPLCKGLDKDYLDHVAGLRGIYAVAFYDVGNAYVNGRQLGPIAHAVGGGLRFDVIWFGLIERTMIRFDVAQTVNQDSPVQFWVGLSHPF